MGTQFKHIVVFAVVVIFTTTLLFTDQTTNANIGICRERNLSVDSYLDHGPIHISNESEFTNLGFSGNGTYLNPYSINRLRIESNQTCIFIENVAAYFTIQNCELKSPDRWEGVGIRLQNSSNGVITGCKIDWFLDGIQLDSVSNCQIFDNDIHWNYLHGIQVSDSSECRVINNTVSDSFYSGIKFYHSSKSIISENILSNNSNYGLELTHLRDSVISKNYAYENWWYGFLIWSSDNCTVFENRICFQIYGIHLWDSTNCRFQDNIFENCSIVISGETETTWIHEMVGNTVNGKLLGYYLNETSLTINADQLGAVILVNCSRTSVIGGEFGIMSSAIQVAYSEDCQIEKVFIYDRIFHGVRIVFSYNITVRDCITSYSYYGVKIMESQNCTLYNNTHVDGYVGVYIGNSPNCMIFQNQISDYLWGICSFQSGNGIISSNHVNECLSGICLSTSDFNRLCANHIFDNVDYGIQILLSINCDVADNEVNGNDKGIYLFKSRNCTIEQNKVYRNRIGIHIDTVSSNNLVFGNIFANNESNAQDDGINTMWDNGLDLGNYWHDFSGTQNYTISGTCQSIDRYPKSIDIHCDAPADLEYVQGAIGNVILWNPTSPIPSSYIIMRNGTMVDTGEWNGSSIEISIDGLATGIYNYTLMVMDAFGQTYSDSVIVHIEPEKTIDFIVMSSSFAVIFLVVVGLIYWRRKMV